MKTLKLGCRGSTLSIIQADHVIDLISSKHPGIQIEKVLIQSLGDKDKTTPISEMNEIGVFTKEIDEAVLKGEVDFSVHSLKDVGLRRPEGLVCAAIPGVRANPRDIILFKKNIEEKIKDGKEIVLGTSSPRRSDLIPPFLQKALPKIGKVKIRTVPLRGNVPTRVEKVLKGEIDAAVLAFAGLERLYNHPEGHRVIAPLLQEVKFMLVPLTVCPGAPGQGALYVETAEHNYEVRKILLSIHDADMAREIDRERLILAENGGGCHQKFGVVNLKLKNLPENVLIIRGENEGGKDISEWRWTPPKKDIAAHIWDGTQMRDQIFRTEKKSVDLPETEAVFIAHSNALIAGLKDKRLYTSGVKSWWKLAAEGLWVEGCADGFGFDFIKETLQAPMLQLPDLNAWLILTHEGAEETWEEGQTLGSYSLETQMNDALIEKLKASDHIFWASFSQYQALKKYIPEGAHQACGAGKTAELIGGNVDVFPSVEAWRSWLRVS